MCVGLIEPEDRHLSEEESKERRKQEEPLFAAGRQIMELSDENRKLKRALKDIANCKDQKIILEGDDFNEDEYEYVCPECVRKKEIACKILKNK